MFFWFKSFARFAEEKGKVEVFRFVLVPLVTFFLLFCQFKIGLSLDIGTHAFETSLFLMEAVKSNLT